MKKQKETKRPIKLRSLKQQLFDETIFKLPNGQNGVSDSDITAQFENVYKSVIPAQIGFLDISSTLTEDAIDLQLLSNSGAISDDELYGRNSTI